MNRVMQKASWFFIAVAAVGFVSFGCHSSAGPADPASNARWQNYLQEHARETSSANAAYQRRQAQLAQKRQNGADRGEPKAQGQK